MDFLAQLQAFKLQLDQVLASQAASKAQADAMIAQYEKEHPLAVSVADQVQKAIDVLVTPQPVP